jgi:hypothetical protein
MTLDLAFIENTAAAAPTVDLSTPSAGGGGNIAAEGRCNLRLVGYVQLGTHTTDSPKFGKKTSPRATLLFEVSGPNHPPVPSPSGGTEARVMSLKFVHQPHKPPHEKSTDFAIFSSMNYNGGKTGYHQMLGEAFCGTVVHKKLDDGTTIAFLDRKVVAPTYEEVIDGEPTGKLLTRTVLPLSTPLRFFMTDRPCKRTWDSLYIAGELQASEAKDGRPARPARTKNYLQELIMASDDFVGSPTQRMLTGMGDALRVASNTATVVTSGDK